jgi:hypothetical protein
MSEDYQPLMQEVDDVPKPRKRKTKSAAPPEEDREDELERTHLLLTSRNLSKGRQTKKEGSLWRC